MTRERSLVVAFLLAHGSASDCAEGTAHECMGQDGRDPPDGFLLGLDVLQTAGIDHPKAEVSDTVADVSPLQVERDLVDDKTRRLGHFDRRVRAMAPRSSSI